MMVVYTKAFFLFVSYFQTKVICSLLSVKYKSKIKYRSIEAQNKNKRNIKFAFGFFQFPSSFSFSFVTSQYQIWFIPLFRLGNSTEKLLNLFRVIYILCL